MSKIIIETDLTNSGTKITVDDVLLTSLCDISFDGLAPCDWTGDDGMFRLSYTESIDGNIKRTTLSNGERNNDKCIGESDDDLQMALKISDFIGNVKSPVQVNLIDSIIDHCEKNKIVCPTREILTTRSETSLRDKATDLGIIF